MTQRLDCPFCFPCIDQHRVFREHLRLHVLQAQAANGGLAAAAAMSKRARLERSRKANAARWKK